MKVECLDYRDLPGQNRLFLHYLYDSERAESLYSPGYTSLESLLRRAEALAGKPPSYPRDKLAKLLSSFHRQLGTHPLALENIEKLRLPQALAVVTGQQLGLFGGPALAVYKAATAVRLAQILEQEGFKAVPVFWLASDDSDFQEVRTTTFFDRKGGPLRITYPGPSKNSERMVGTLSLEAVSDCLGKLEHEGWQGEFQAQVLERLRECYSPRRRFAEALGAWLADLFKDYGLVIFDSLHPAYKDELRSVFGVAIERRKEIITALQERAELLAAAGFDAQVQVKDSETLLFLIQGNRRFKLEYAGGQYLLRDEGIPLSESRLRTRLDENAEQFAPNVLLRPILQDRLFPTVAYVGGAAEICYFGQVNAIRRFWDMDIAIFPRAGITVVDRKAQRILGRYGLEVKEILRATPLQIAERILSRGDSSYILEEFDALQLELEEKLTSLQSGLAAADPTVTEMLKGAEKKILYQVNKAKRRFITNYQTRAEHLDRHLNYLYSHLYPEGKLQERVINFNEFLMEEGEGFLGRLMEVVNPFCRGHQIVYV